MNDNRKTTSADEVWAHLSQREKDYMTKMIVANIDVEERHETTNAPMIIWKKKKTKPTNDTDNKGTSL